GTSVGIGCVGWRGTSTCTSGTASGRRAGARAGKTTSARPGRPIPEGTRRGSCSPTTGGSSRTSTLGSPDLSESPETFVRLLEETDKEHEVEEDGKEYYTG